MGNPCRPEELHRDPRTHFLHRVAPLVEHGPHAALEVPDQEGIPDAQRALLDEYRDDRALSDVELSFDDDPLRIAVRVRLELQEFGLQEDLLEEVVDPLTGLRGDVAAQDVSTELFDLYVLLQKLLLDLHGIGRR